MATCAHLQLHTTQQVSTGLHYFLTVTMHAHIQCESARSLSQIVCCALVWVLCVEMSQLNVSGWKYKDWSVEKLDITQSSAICCWVSALWRLDFDKQTEPGPVQHLGEHTLVALAPSGPELTHLKWSCWAYTLPPTLRKVQSPAPTNHESTPAVNHDVSASNDWLKPLKHTIRVIRTT